VINEVINPEKGKTEVINEVINRPRGENDGINDGINRPRGKNDGINEVINPGKAKIDGINDGINRLRGENDGINDGIKSKLSHIAVKKRERIEKLLEIINENPSSVASDLIAIQLGISRPTAERYLAELRRMEIVKREGSNKNGKWLIL
jgi:iclR helix-turn-helix domain